MKKKIKFYLMADKERNAEIGLAMGFAPGSQAERAFANALDVVELHAEVETNTGEIRILNILTEDTL